MKNQNPLLDTLNKYLDKDLSLNRSLLRTGKMNNSISLRCLNKTQSGLSGAMITETVKEVGYLAPSMTTTVNRPIVLGANKQVIELEKSGSLGYNTLNIKTAKKRNAYVPLCDEQEDIGMVQTSLKPIVPILEKVGDNQAIVVIDKGGFKYPYVRPPKFEIVDIPKSYLDAGPNFDKKNLTAAERQEAFEFTQKKQFADEYFNQAIERRAKTVGNLQRRDYQRGVPLLYSSADVTNEIYGDKAREQIAEENRKSLVHLERSTLLASRGSSIRTNGNILIPESLDDRVNVNKQFRHKGGANLALSYDETHQRIFNRKMEKPANPLRTQYLRDQELSGKQYNIVTHTAITEWPSNSFNRIHDKRLDHPSQSALEEQRNLQGSLSGSLRLQTAPSVNRRTNTSNFY